MIDSISKMTPEGVTTWNSWEELPEEIKVDIELALIVKGVK